MPAGGNVSERRMSLFDRERLEVRTDLIRGGSVLYCNVSESKAALPDGFSWTVDFDLEGTACVRALETPPLICMDLLDAWAFVNPEDESEIHVLVDDESMPLRDFQQRHTIKDIPLQVAGRAKPMIAEGFLLHQSVGGSHVLWSLGFFYTNLFDAVMPFAGWYQSWWQWWKLWLGKLGLSADLHLRKAAVDEERQERDEFTPGDERFLLEPTVSTYALIPLVARLASASRGRVQKDPVQQQGWQLLLQALALRIATYMPEWDCIIHLDQNAQVPPGLPQQGLNMIRVRITGAFADMSPVATSDVADVREVVAMLIETDDVEHVALDVLLVRLAYLGKPGQWLMKQLSSQFAAILEAEVLEHHAADEPPELLEVEDEEEQIVEAEVLLAGRRTKEKARRLDKIRAACKIGKRRIKNLGLRILMLFYCMRKEFSNQQYIGLSVDAGTVGAKNRLLGFFTLPSGEAGYGPPQVSKAGIVWDPIRL